MNKRRILHVCYFDPDIYPGVYNSSNILAEKGWEVDVICFEMHSFHGKSFDPRVKLHRLNSNLFGNNGWRRYSSFINRIKLEGKNQKWDVVIGHDMHGYVAASISGVVPSSRIIFWSQDLYDPTTIFSGHKLLYFLKKEFIKKCPLVIAPSKIRGDAIKTLLSFEGEIMVVYNSPRKFKIVPDEQWRSRLFISNDTFMVVYGGGLVADRHILNLVRSVSLWQKPSILVLAGHANMQMLSNIKGLISRYDLLNRIIMVGHLPNIFGLIREAHVGISLFSSEYNYKKNNKYRGMASNKIFEYLSQGKPAIVSSNKETVEFMEEYKCGICISDYSEYGIANAVNSMIVDNNYYDKASISAKHTHNCETYFENKFNSVEEIMQIL